MFVKTKSALLDLQQSLLCLKCNKVCLKLMSLGSCEHLYCRLCVMTLAGYPCPSCGLPSEARDINEVRNLSHVAALCSQMISLIDNNEELPTEGIDKCLNQTDGSEYVQLKDVAKRNQNTNSIPLSETHQQSPVVTSLPGSSRNRSKATGAGRRRKKANEIPSHGIDTLTSVQSSPQNQCLISSTTTTTPVPGDKRRKQNLCKRNAKGETLLQVATIKGDIEAVQTYLEAGANPNVKDHAGWTPLHEAIGRGRADIASLLIESGASVNTPGLDNETPLHDAVTNEHVDCVRLLIDKGANVFSRNAHGHSVMDIAHNKVIKEMLLTASQVLDPSDEQLPLLDESTKPLCFSTSNLTPEESRQIALYAKTLQAKVVSDVTPEVTHLITQVDDKHTSSRTLKYLQALLSGKHIVSFQWLESSYRQKQRVSEESFHVSGCHSHPKSDGPRKALLNRLKQLPRLFDGCQFYFYGKFDQCSLTKTQLTGLVKLASGSVLTREPHLYNLDDYPYTHPYHAQGTPSLADCTIYKVYQDGCPNPPCVQSQRMAWLPASWLLQSIATFSFLGRPK